MASTAATDSVSRDFLTNYGHYMPRIHCLQTADGSPDWPWITALIALNVIVIAGYIRIFLFWRSCYRDESEQDRNKKLMDLAWIFVGCAICGYGLSIVIFFWPVYRLLAMALVGLSFLTWRFAIDLEPFRQSFASHRLQRELNDSLQRENETLEAQNAELESAHQQLSETAAELKRSNAELDQFAYAASHDLKAPLRAIDSLSGFLIEDLEDQIPEDSMNDLRMLAGRVNRMERMLDGMLSYSRLRTQRFADDEFRVGEALDSIVSLLDVPDDFTIEIRGDDPVIRSPRSPLEQAIRNLIDNAIKHFDSTDGRVVVTVEDHRDRIRFSIRDNGPGIDPKFHDQVFQIFQTLRRRDEVDSNGMGLALVKRIVEERVVGDQTGRIQLHSAVGQGAEFVIDWPIESEEPSTTVASLDGGSNETMTIEIDPSEPSPSGGGIAPTPRSSIQRPQHETVDAV